VFDEDRTGMNPIRSLAGDTLHSVFLGPLQRWTAAVIMRVLRYIAIRGRPIHHPGV
jgi:hypothetical protein